MTEWTAEKEQKGKSCIDLRCNHLQMDRVPGRGYPRNIWSCPVRTIQVGYTVELMPQKNCPRLREIAESEIGVKE